MRSRTVEPPRACSARRALLAAHAAGERLAAAQLIEFGLPPHRARGAYSASGSAG